MIFLLHVAKSHRVNASLYLIVGRGATRQSSERGMFSWEHGLDEASRLGLSRRLPTSLHRHRNVERHNEALQNFLEREVVNWMIQIGQGPEAIMQPNSEDACWRKKRRVGSSAMMEVESLWRLLLHACAREERTRPRSLRRREKAGRVGRIRESRDSY